MNEAATATLEQPTRRAATSVTARLRAALTDAVVRKGLLSVFDQAVVSGTSFVTSVAVGRLCGQDDLGVYYLALSIVLFVRGVQEQLISAPYAVFCHRKQKPTGGDPKPTGCDPWDLATYTGSTLLHQGVLLLAVVVGTVIFAGLVATGHGPIGFATTAWVLVGAAPLMLLRESLRHFAFGRLALKSAVGIDVTVAVLQLGGLAVLIVTNSLTVGRVYLLMGLACAAATAGWWFLRSERVAFRWSRFLPDWRQNWRFSKWALASHLVGCSTPYLLPWFVLAVEGTAATGLLAACTTLIGLGNAFLMGMANYLTPKTAQAFAQGGVRELKRVLKKTFLLFTITLGGFTLFCGLAGNLLAVLIYGSGYDGAGPILNILAFGLFASSIGLAAGNGLWAMEKPAANFRADLCALFTTVLSAALLTPWLGVTGAALSTALGASADAAVRCWTLQRSLTDEAKTDAGRERTPRAVPEGLMR